MVVILAAFLSVSAVAKEKFATKKEAEAMVVKTVTALKNNRSKTLEDITDQGSKIRRSRPLSNSLRHDWQGAGTWRKQQDGRQ